ncbi:hypothetical protein [Pseudonocardia sp.]|uniref:hypothetical protein n=1 Tax=Pseudonocardia sp. TaxID=60912 RepID=UPI002619D0F9|nr:hypothetical protein [Pseudonocardia sp.]
MPVHDRRFVAVSVGAVELLRPESDLLRLVEGAGYVDVLIAADDPPVGPPAPLGVLAGCAVDGPACDGDDDGYDDRDAEPGDEVFAALGLPDLHVHRLGLHPPVGPQHEDDLVAALSELVGFDPEPGVFLLGPAVAPADPARSVVDQAAQRIARVYGIPLLRFRCHELCVVTAPGT